MYPFRLATDINVKGAREVLTVVEKDFVPSQSDSASTAFSLVTVALFRLNSYDCLFFYQALMTEMAMVDFDDKGKSGN